MLLSACRNATHSNDELTKIKNSISQDTSLSFSITTATEEDFETFKKHYKDKLIQDTLNIVKSKGVLEIPLVQPHYPVAIIFKDTLVSVGDEEERDYNYLGQFKDLGIYLVDGTFWENYECYLIDKESGWKTTLWNRPYLSPSSKYLANLSLPYGFEGMPNGIQIWETKNTQHNTLTKYLELDQQIWTPNDFVWENDESLILKVAKVETFWARNGQLTKSDFNYLRLKLH